MDNGVDTKALASGMQGKSCSLVPLSLEHSAYIVKWRNDPENSQWFLSDQKITPDGHEKWLQRQLSTGKNFNWLIVLNDGTPVGMVAAYNLDLSNRMAEFGRLLIGEKSALGKGIGQEATELVIALASASGISELYLSVIARNTRARALYEKLGFAITRDGETTEMRKVLRKPVT